MNKQLLFIALFSLLATNLHAEQSNWSGPYLGIHLGGATARHNRTNDSNYQNSYNSNGGLNLGIQAGYNLQKENFLFGLEAQLSHLNLSGDDGQMGGTLDGTKINWSAAIGPKIGYIIKNDYLIYGTAGGVIAGLKTTNYSAMEKSEDSKFGYFVGLGIDYRIKSNWITNVNYSISDLGDNKVDATSVFPFTTQHKYQHLSLGLSYKF